MHFEQLTKYLKKMSCNLTHNLIFCILTCKCKERMNKYTHKKENQGVTMYIARSMQEVKPLPRISFVFGNNLDHPNFMRHNKQGFHFVMVVPYCSCTQTTVHDQKITYSCLDRLLFIEDEHLSPLFSTTAELKLSPRMIILA